MATQEAQILIVIVIGWLTIGFCVGMTLFEIVTRPRGMIALDLRDASRGRPRDTPAETAIYKDAA